MVEFQEGIEEAIRSHAEERYPAESCGLLLVQSGRQRYFPCHNTAERPADDFVLDGRDFIKAEELGTVIAVVHSHPGAPPYPSECDLVNCEATGLTWVIVNWPTGQIHQFDPSGYEAPLVGREFSYGTNDCYSLVRDWYIRERGITLPNPEREGFWWNEGRERYLTEFPQNGFKQVSLTELQEGDVLLMTHESSVANHCAIFLEGGFILHHVMNRLSTRDLWGGYWRKVTRAAFRYTP